MPSPSFEARAARSAAARSAGPVRSLPSTASTLPRTRPMIAAISWSVSTGGSLHVHRVAVDLPRVDDRHDHGVARLVLRESCLTGRAAGRIHDDFADAGTDRIDSDHVRTRVASVGVDLSDDEEGHPLHQWLFAARHQCAGYPSELHCSDLLLVWGSRGQPISCLLYTSDAADDLTRVDLGGRRILKK